MAVCPDIQTPELTNALLVMAKRPISGGSKTRLVPPLSQEEAAALYECFLRDSLELMRQVPGSQPVVVYTPGHAGAYFADLAPDFEHLPQQGRGLGTRLDNALTHYLGLGYRRVVAVDSDSPTLPLTYLMAAFEALARPNDVVLGPADDGGYYLIGLKKPAPRLLRQVRMSTSHVLKDTLALAKEEGLRVELLPSWYDVDDTQSLARLAAELCGAAPGIARHTRAFLQRQLHKG
jgi:rSAM/selenodomain-associated transferase 1